MLHSMFEILLTNRLSIISTHTHTDTPKHIQSGKTISPHSQYFIAKKASTIIHTDISACTLEHKIHIPKDKSTNAAL